MSLTEKTISGISWTFLDRFANQIIQFIIGIILARLLTPHDYGLTGMVAVFFTISNVFIICGFGDALVRKSDATLKDYSTVFVFNIVLGIFFYIVFVLVSGSISVFFKEPLLQNIIIILSISIVINSAGIIPRTVLWKTMKFKKLAIISLITTISSGVIAILMAFYDYGVWSLVVRAIVGSIVGTFLMWIFARVKIRFKFSKSSFKELFGFSSRILISELINQVFLNIYSLVIAKFFSTRQLGLYTRADNYKDLPSKTLDSVIQSVSYPVLAEMKDDKVQLKKGYKKLIESTMFLTFLLMFVMAASAQDLILGLIGNKWAEAIPYLQLLCFVGMFYPLHSLNLNMLRVLGRSDLFLKLEMIKKAIFVPGIILGIFFGIKIMIIGMIVNSIIAFFINSFWSGKLINYKSIEQLRDVIPSFLFGLTVGLLILIPVWLFQINPLIMLVIQLILSVILTIIMGEVIRFRPYLTVKQIAIGQIMKILNKTRFQKTP